MEKKTGKSQKTNNFSLEDYNRESKREQWREEWHQRIQYRCTIVNEKGLVIKCRKNCAYCSYYWQKKPNKVSIDILEDEYGIELPSNFETPVEYAMRKEKEEKVNEAIEALPEEDLKITARMVSEGYSYQEIANVLGISKPGAYKKWLKVKELLRILLQDYYNSLNS